MEPINLADKLSAFADHWNPRVVAELNGQQVKLVKFAGAFVWHHHASEDELFLVLAGRMRMGLRDEQGERHVDVNPGEFIVIPRGVHHRPASDPPASEVHVLLFEPAGTLNTGSAAESDDRTRHALERL